jgi:HEAT repeat protein
LQRFLLNPDPVTRKNAVYGLRYSTSPSAVDTLIDAITDKDATVRERALTSLREVTGQAIGGTVASPESVQGEWRSWWRANKDKFVMPELQFLCRMK